jgi:hypothetical protein
MTDPPPLASPRSQRHGDAAAAKQEDKLFQIRKLDNRLQHFSMLLWDVGEYVSIDEWVCGFQGRDRDKATIKFKKEGDGYLADVLACGHDGIKAGGYAYAWRFRHSCNEGRVAGFSALHNRCFELLKTLRTDDTNAMKQQWRTLTRDNLYNTPKFARYVYKNFHVKVLGIMRKNVAPKCVAMEKATTKATLEAVKGTTKAAVMTGDPDCPNLLCVTVYDNVPVRFITTAHEQITWERHQRMVYNYKTARTESVPFLRLNLIDDYNHWMGWVDQLDQVRTPPPLPSPQKNGSPRKHSRTPRKKSPP